jgi:hypothetical protein
MVGNKNTDDNDSVILVMEMYVVYVENMDPLMVVVAVVVVVVDRFVYYDFEQVIVCAVVVVDIEKLRYMVVAVGYVVDDHSVVLYNKLVPNRSPNHWIIEYYFDRIRID